MFIAWLVFAVLVAASVAWNVGGVVLAIAAAIALLAVGGEPVRRRRAAYLDGRRSRRAERHESRAERQRRAEQDQQLADLQRQLR